jgi:hypothetical protein
MLHPIRTAMVVFALLPQLGCDAKKDEYERLANELRPPMERIASKNAEYMRTIEQLKSATKPDYEGPGMFQLMQTASLQCMDVKSDLQSLQIDPGRFEDPALKLMLEQLDAAVDDYVRARSVCERTGGMECMKACQGGWMGTNGVLIGVRDEFGKVGVALPEVGVDAPSAS